MTTILAQVLTDSVCRGHRLTTFRLRYPRFIHAEVMTHRVFSRNASSSRAIPVKRFLEMIKADIAAPIHWGKNQPGMQAREEMSDQDKFNAREIWLNAAEDAMEHAENLAALGAHKQIVNRILEPFQHIEVILTATEFRNFFELRCHADAQPEIQALAMKMQDAMEASTPKVLGPGMWHLPFIRPEDWAAVNEDVELLKKISAARCCRVSYMKHDGTAATLEEDLALCDMLSAARPFHASPFEHQATPMSSQADWVLQGNFSGWVQHRKEIEARLFA